MNAATAKMLERQRLLIERTVNLDEGSIATKLRDLIEACEKSLSPEDEVYEDQHTLLDMDCDGHRYLLMRMPDRSLRLSLSPREQEIGRMVAKGYPNKAIAAVLEISSWTVCTHLRRMFAKMSVSSRAAMVAKLIEEGVLHDSVAVGKS